MKKFFLILLLFCLLFNFVASQSATTSTVFDIYLDGVCDEQNGFWWEDGVARYGVAEPDFCRGGDGEAGTDDDCCPPGTICSEEEDGYYCSEPDICEDVDSCSDYDEANCEDDPCNRASDGNVCGGYRKVTEACEVAIDDYYIGDRDSCECIWDEDDGGCKQTHEVRPSTYSTYTDIDVDGTYTCKLDIETTDCVNGQMTITKNAVIEWGQDLEEKWGSDKIEQIKTACEPVLCSGGTEQVSCGQPIIKLPFFTWINIVLVCLGLGVVYFFRGKKQHVER